MLFGKNERNMSVHYVIDRAGDESWKNTEFMQILIYAQNSERLCFVVRFKEYPQRVQQSQLFR